MFITKRDAENELAQFVAEEKEFEKAEEKYKRHLAYVQRKQRAEMKEGDFDLMVRRSEESKKRAELKRAA